VMGFALGSNLSGGQSEVNFINTANSGGGPNAFSFYQQTGTSTGALLLAINRNGQTVIGGGASLAGVALTLQGSVGTCNHTPGASSETVACTSDRVLKRNIVDAGSALAKIMPIQVRSFDVITDGSHVEFGAVAQELQTVNPSMVKTGARDLLTVDQPDPWMLLKAIQELAAANDVLKAELERLRAAR
jgi:hypothetical protein